MQFFEQQALARRRTTRLVVLFAASIALTVLVMNLLVGMTYGMVQWISLPLDTPITRNLDTKSAPGTAMWLMLERTWQLLVPSWVLWVTTVAVLAVIVAATLRRMRQIAQGGPAVARLLDARPVVRMRANPLERRLLNIVEEMAIAAGLPVPRAYVLDRAASINALTAGFTPRDAVVIVTHGALVALERDELQSVVAHEMSHVLNGDVRLNTWMIGLLAGLVSVGALGGFLLAGSDPEEDAPRATRAVMARATLGMPFAILGGVGLFLVGGALALLGAAGLVFARLIKATLSREREFLADASAVQFTRNPEALAGALARIGGHRFGSRLHHRQAEALSHMFFAASVLSAFERAFATHPPIAERIERVSPGLHAALYLERHPWKSEEERSAEAMREAQAEPQEGMLAFVPVGRAESVVASIGNPLPEHARYAASLLHSLPDALHDTLATADGAKAVLLALALAPEGEARRAQLAGIEKEDPLVARIAAETARSLPHLESAYRLPLVELAIPVLAALDAGERRAFLSQLRSVIDADGRLTPREFVLYVLLRQALAAPVRARAPQHRSVAEIPHHAALILALLAGASQGASARESFGKALAVAGLPASEPMPDATTISLDAVIAALEHLDGIAPLAKPALIKACVAAVETPSGIRMAEAELLRAVAEAIDCPLPPLGVGRVP